MSYQQVNIPIPYHAPRGIFRKQTTTTFHQAPVKNQVEDKKTTSNIQVTSKSIPNESLIPNIKPSSKPRSVNLNLPTSPAFSKFSFKLRKMYFLCDTLEVNIMARDIRNQTKVYGGDYFWIWISSKEQQASAAADEIIDHQNGTYTAKFKLHWSGKVDIGVLLVHSSEAVSVLRRVRDKFPVRGNYRGRFQYKNITVESPCHFSRDMYLKPTSSDRDNNRTYCNFTDPRTGLPWFCVKPENLTCDKYTQHATGPGRFGAAQQTVMLSKKDRQVYTR